MGAVLIALGSALAGAVGGYYLAARAAKQVLEGARDRAADQLGDFAELFDPGTEPGGDRQVQTSAGSHSDSPIRPDAYGDAAPRTPAWWDRMARLGGE